MRNQAPIFVSGFPRGGTTILMNLLASHPDVCTLGETHQIFKGRNVTDPPWRVLARCLFYELPVLATVRQNLFSPRLLRPRKRVPPVTRRFIDYVLYREKCRGRHPHYNRFKSPGVEYRPDEIARARLVTKNLNGAVLLNDLFRVMYPDARFIHLVRNGLAVCEGQLRRGQTTEAIGQRYRRLGATMLAESERYANTLLVRFEDVLYDPLGQLQRLWAHLQLDPQAVTHVRMQRRKTLDAQGRHRLEGGAEWDLVWYPLEQLHQHLDRGINHRQVGRLSGEGRAAFLQQAGRVMRQLGYAA